MRITREDYQAYLKEIRIYGNIGNLTELGKAIRDNLDDLKKAFIGTNIKAIELYTEPDDGFDEDISLKTKPKSPMKQGKIHQAEEYIKEIKDLVENLDMVHITNDLDLDSLSKAKDYIKAFIQKQQ